MTILNIEYFTRESSLNIEMSQMPRLYFVSCHILLVLYGVMRKVIGNNINGGLRNRQDDLNMYVLTQRHNDINEKFKRLPEKASLKLHSLGIFNNSYLCLGHPRGPLPVKIFKALLPFSILTTSPAHLNLLDLITLTILGEWYKL